MNLTAPIMVSIDLWLAIWIIMPILPAVATTNNEDDNNNDGNNESKILLSLSEQTK